MTDAPTILAMVLTAGALARLILNVHRENTRLRANEKLARDCLRDVMAHRDALVLEMHEERRRAYEMQLELDAYREEASLRDEARRVAGRAMAN